MSKKRAQAAPEFADAFTMVDGELQETPTTAPKRAGTAPAPKVTAATKPSRPRQDARTYAKTQSVDHDLFKLELGKFRRDLSLDRDGSLMDEVEHVHYFHTVDSAGRVQKLSNLVGGHFHEMTVEQDPEGGVPIVTAGPAMVYISKKVGKKAAVKLAVPYEEDQHTHEVTYMGSQKIQLRKANIEFAKMQAEVAARAEQTLDGVVG